MYLEKVMSTESGHSNNSERRSQLMNNSKMSPGFLRRNHLEISFSQNTGHIHVEPTQQ